MNNITKRAKVLLGAFAGVLSISLICGGTSFAAPASKDKVRTIHWVVAHARDDKSFSALLDKFAKRVNERSGGSLKVQFIDAKGNSGRRDSEADKEAYQQILDGKADMSQIAADRMGVKVIDMPFMFRSYQHAEAVWRSPTGQKLLSQIAAQTEGKTRGLAFAYSGGYRIMVGQTAINSVADFKGLKMRDTGGGPADLLRELGVDLVKVSPEEMSKVEVPVSLPTSGKVDLEETEVNGLAYISGKYPEVVKKLKFANITRHSMLVTAMVANEKFLSSLDAAQSKVLTEEVAALAETERKLSVVLAKKNLELFAKKGLGVVTLPPAEQEKFAAVGEKICKKSPELAELIQEIRDVKDYPIQLASAR